MLLANKVAIITGAAAGIGAATALLFAREGARIVAVDLDEQRLSALASQIEALGGKSVACVADVSKSAEVQRIVETAQKTYGRIDVLFNNAGVVPNGTVEDTPEEQWDAVVAVNVKSVYLLSRAVLPLMRAAGGGCILNTASATVLRTVANRACYTATKAAVWGLTRSMAVDYVKENIRVNCICPGTIDTPSLRSRLAAAPDPVEARKNFIARQPMGRFGTAEEVAEGALYLASDKAAFITGVAFSIDGGFTL